MGGQYGGRFKRRWLIIRVRNLSKTYTITFIPCLMSPILLPQACACSWAACSSQPAGTTRRYAVCAATGPPSTRSATAASAGPSSWPSSVSSTPSSSPSSPSSSPPARPSSSPSTAARGSSPNVSQIDWIKEKIMTELYSLMVFS